MKLLEEAVKEYYGERCPDHNPGCIVCQAWAEFDEIKRTQQKKFVFDPKTSHGVKFVAPRSLEIAEFLTKGEEK
jgi:hypothetical protein